MYRTYKKSYVKTKDEIKKEALPNHIVTLIKTKYEFDISEDDIATCYHTSTGSIVVSFWRKGKGSAYQDLVTAIKTRVNMDMNLYFNFMLTQRRGKLLFEIRKLKKATKISKFYSDEEGRISFKIDAKDKPVRVTDVYEEGSTKLKTWTVEELLNEISK